LSDNSGNQLPGMFGCVLRLIYCMILQSYV